MSAIFAPEITTLEAQLVALQAQIAAVQEQRVALNKAESVAAGIVQAVRGGVEEFQQITGISDDAIARVKQAVLDIFGGSPDNGNDNGNGNLPLEPAPQPNDDGGSEVAFAVELEQGSELLTSDDQEQVVTHAESQQEQPTALDKLKAKLNRAYPWSAPQMPTEQDQSDVVVADVITVQPEPLTGQSCEWASPWASPLASPLATPLCCQMSDAPQSALQGQSVEIACVISDVPQKPEYIELVPVSHEVAYQRRTHDGEIICCYVGFNNKTKAKQWGEFLAVHHSVASGFQLRNSERLTAFKYEIKLWGMSLKQIERCAECDLQKSPPPNFGTAPKRKVEPVAPLPKPLQIDDIEVGDTVRSTTVKHWSYVVLAKQNDGFLDCKRIGADHIRLAMHPASVELVSKAIKVEDSEVSQHVSIDVNDVPVGARLERTDDALITEYRVWAWVVVRVFGRPEVQQKCLGTLTEGTQGISARRPHGMSNPQSFQHTLDAVKYLIQGASLKLADIEVAYNRHQEQATIAAIPAVTPEQAKADLFGDVPALADAFGGFSF